MAPTITMNAEKLLYWLQPKPNTLEIHTTDRMKYRRCRRNWNWTSMLRGNLTGVSERENAKTFTGTGGHFAMEDYHGYKRFKSPIDAFRAYVLACDPNRVPYEIDDILDMMSGLLKHYTDDWLKNRPQYHTLWLDDKPMVELNLQIPLKVNGTNNVVYDATIDRICYDDDGVVYAADYKFVADFDVAKLAYDSQVSSYSWIMDQIFPEYGGLLFQQMKKHYPGEPNELKNGSISTAMKQNTTYNKLYAALMKKHGSIPQTHVDVLNYFAELEQEVGDKYIRRDLVTRTPEFIQNQWEDMLLEVREMLNPKTLIYPNPTKDCSWDCELRNVCLAKNDGEDWEYQIAELFQRREDVENWRERVVYPR